MRHPGNPEGSTETTLAVAEMVAEFHRAFGDGSHELGIPWDSDTETLRLDLLKEEVEEYYDGVWRGNIIAIADALADMAYVIYGTAYTYGIDLDAVLREVHRSNMTKDFNNVGGKIKKGAAYEPPDIERILYG